MVSVVTAVTSPVTPVALNVCEPPATTYAADGLKVRVPAAAAPALTETFLSESKDWPS
jgi:hypothetical protein